jgi:hypothetical protein
MLKSMLKSCLSSFPSPNRDAPGRAHIATAVSFQENFGGKETLAALSASPLPPLDALHSLMALPPQIGE